jgi:hypothetical protein
MPPSRGEITTERRGKYTFVISAALPTRLFEVRLIELAK